MGDVVKTTEIQVNIEEDAVSETQHERASGRTAYDAMAFQMGVIYQDLVREGLLYMGGIIGPDISPEKTGDSSCSIHLYTVVESPSHVRIPSKLLPLMVCSESWCLTNEDIELRCISERS